MTKDSKKEQHDEQAQTGYATPLFEERKMVKNDDDVLGGMKSLEKRYHDEDMVLKVANGLCYDIFFRAQYVHAKGFEDIPDFWEDVPEEEQRKTPPKKDNSPKKPLDSRNRNRTYRLDTEIEEEKPRRKRKPRPKRNASRSGKPRRRRSRPPKKR